MERGEALLGSLTAVVSVRIVTRADGTVDEVHLLTTDEVAPKQTVRNVESALRAHFDLDVDHRKISVAQQAPSPRPQVRTEDSAAATEEKAEVPGPAEPTPSSEQWEPTLVAALPSQAEERRILFWGHLIESERNQRVRMRVAVEWKGQRYTGDVEGPDLPGPRLEALAKAALKAVESAVVPELMERQGRRFHLSLDGVKEFEAFDRDYVLVSVYGASGRDVTALSGTAAVNDSRDRAVIMATLQATDRWVRGRI